MAQRLALSASCRRIGVAAGAAAAAASSFGKSTDNEETSDGGHMIVKKIPIELPALLTANQTLCDFRLPRISKLARSRTIRRMEDTSTKETLRSRYDVQWKNPLGEGGFGAVYLATDRKTASEKIKTNLI